MNTRRNMLNEQLKDMKKQQKKTPPVEIPDDLSIMKEVAEDEKEERKNIKTVTSLSKEIQMD